MPLPCRSRAASTTSAPRRSTFLGSHPRSWHVPPYGSSSTIATDQPAARQRFATVLAAAPVPTTTRSKVSSITVFQSVVSRRGSRRLRLEPAGEPAVPVAPGRRRSARDRSGRGAPWCVVVDLGALLLDEVQVRAVVLWHFLEGYVELLGERTSLALWEPGPLHGGAVDPEPAPPAVTAGDRGHGAAVEHDGDRPALGERRPGHIGHHADLRVVHTERGLDVKDEGPLCRCERRRRRQE